MEVAAGMEAKQIQALERLLVQLVQARRCLQLYPPTNHLVAESRAALHSTLRSAASAASGMDPLSCEVRRDGFYVGEQQLASDRVAVERFARLLYLNGAKLFGVSAQATPQDADAFVDASLALENNAGDPQWNALECPRLGVERLEEAAVTTGERAVDVDLVSYLNAQRDGDSTASAAGATATPGASELRALMKFFNAVQEGSEAEREALMTTLTDSTRMAEAFTFIANAAPRHGAKSLSADGIRQALKHIRFTLESLPQENREFMIRNLTEAILSTDNDTRDCILSEVLSAGIGNDALQEELTKRLPPRLGASVLMHHVNVHDGTASTVSSFVDSLPNDIHRQQLKNLLDVGEEPIEDFDPITPPERMKLTQTTGTAAVPEHQESPEEIMQRAARLQQLGMQMMRVSREELADLKQSVEAHTEIVHREQDAFTLFLLFATGQMEVKDARLLERLQGTLHDALHMERFELLNRVIEFALGNLRDDVRPDTFRVLSQYLTPLYQEKQFESYIRTLAQGKAEGCEGSESVLLESIARGAAPVLLQELENEQVKRRRFVLLSLLVAMGPVIAPKLRESLDSPQWYVVRNAIYLLGKLRDAASLPKLGRCLDHDDARVRLEAVDAIEELDGEGIEQHLKHALNDSDPKVRGHAAAALARRGDSTHFHAFISELQSHPWKMLRRPDYAIGVIGAIGTLGGAESAQVVRGFSRWCWLPSKRRNDLRRACDRALQDIARRSTGPSPSPQPAQAR